MRWASPEILLEKRFTLESDTWSFGIMMYEVITRGLHPYHTIQTNTEVSNYVLNQSRLANYNDCIDATVWSMMLQIWSHSPNDRPKFNTILETIDSVCKNMKSMDDITYLEPDVGDTTYMEPVTGLRYDN